MSNTFTLDAIREAAQEKFGDTVITVGDEDVVLLNPLRLSRDARKVLTSVSENASAEDADQFEVFGDAIVAVAANAAAGKRLVKALDGDLTVVMALFEHYMGATQAGEA